MIKMSFFDGTLNKEKLKKFIIETEKPIKYTFGFKWKRPTTFEKTVTKETALEIVEREYLLKAYEKEEFLDLNAFGGNDME